MRPFTIKFRGQAYPAAYFIRDAFKCRVGNPKGYATIRGASRMCLPNVRGSLYAELLDTCALARMAAGLDMATMWSIEAEPIDQEIYKAWNNWRRSGYPSTDPVADSVELVV